MRRIGVLAAAVSAVAFWAAAASAAEVQLRGGWAGSLEEFPFAREDDSDAPINTDYGAGAFGEADVHLDGLFGGFGLEFGADFALLDKSTDTGGSLDSDCSTEGTATQLGLISDCHDIVFLEADTQVITADILGTKDLLAGLRVAFGATGLFLESDLDGDHIFPAGFESFVDRDTSLDAYGIKAGLEHSLPLMNTSLSLHTEIYGSWVWGERTVEINDLRTSNGNFLNEEFATFEDDIDVPVLDATVALSWKLTEMTGFEVGGKYRRLFGAMFTLDTASGTGVGSDSADLDYWAVFGGVTFTL